MSPQGRVRWIDIARGIGILLVIYGHGLNADSYRFIIYSFHMPLFFFLSGVVFHVRKYEHFTHFVTKTTKNILIPYFLFALASFLIWIISTEPNKWNSHVIREQFITMFYGSGHGDYLLFNNLLWFLPCLFVVKIFFGLIVKFVQKKRYIILALIISSLIGYMMYILTPKLALPFGTEIAFSGLVFFGGGFLFSKMTEKTELSLRRHAVVLFVIFSLVCVFFAIRNYDIYGVQIDMKINRLNNYFYFYAAALSGIFSCLILSMLIKKQQLLEYLGKNSLILFVWHLVVFSYLSKFFLLFTDAQTIRELRNIVLAPVYTILSIIIILLIARALKKLHITVLKKMSF
jgi:acyltransferase